MITEDGKEYLGFICANLECRMPVILGEVSPSNLDEFGRLQLASRLEDIQATCPHCKLQSGYTIKQFQRFQVKSKGQLS
jgi:hypothetical protein